MAEMKRVFLFAVLLQLNCLFVFAADSPPPVQVLLGDVKDTRTTGKFFAGLEVEVKLLGDAVADTKSVRATVTKCVDDTGRDLLDPAKVEQDFQVRGDASENTTIQLRFRNPARKATSIKELTGTLELFMPQKDPDATVTVESFQKQIGTPLPQEALKKTGIQITVWTKEQYDAMRQKKKEEAQKKAKADVGEAIAQGVGQFFDGFTAIGPNDVTMEVKDPNQKLVTIEFRDSSGKKIDNRGRSSMGNKPEQQVTYHFGSKLPDTTQMVILVAAPKALLSTPFNLANTVLP